LPQRDITALAEMDFHVAKPILPVSPSQLAPGYRDCDSSKTVIRWGAAVGAWDYAGSCSPNSTSE